MAALIALSNFRSSALTRKFWPRTTRLSTFEVSSRQLNISSIFANNDFRQSEQSWVKKILKGSGPSQDVDDVLDEEEIVEVEPQYMEIIHAPKATFIDRPKTRIRSFKPPENVIERLKAITLDVLPDRTHENWKEVDLKDNNIKYQILSKCFTVFKHDVPNFLLSKMHTMDGVVAFYQTEVKDTTKFDELSTVELPPNLKIHWDYNDDSRLELYQDYMDYVKPRHTQKPPEWKYKPSSGV